MQEMHPYSSHIVWTGNTGQGTRSYKSYQRSWDITVPDKPVIHCSNDPLLGGDSSRMNPEDLLLSSLSACHMLWYLHYASEVKISVLEYEDIPVATGEILPSGAGRFVNAILRPTILIERGNDISLAHKLHDRIHEVCFIARSVKFPVTYEASIRSQA